MEAHSTSHEPVRSEDELRRTAFGVGNRRVREVFKAGLANTLNRQRSEELRPPGIAWCVRELRDLRPGQTDPIRGACKRASLIRKDQHRTTHGVSACAPLPLEGETTPRIPDSARWSQRTSMLVIPAAAKRRAGTQGLHTPAHAAPGFLLAQE